jgi:transcriptional regulator with XRE-family HTH domain
MSKTLDDKQQFIELRAKGYSFSKIAEQLNISKPTLIQWSQDEETCRDITNLRALYIDELQEKYEMTKRHRIAVFGEVLERAKTELDKRDLSEVPTDKLVNLMIRVSDTLKQDETQIEILGEPQLAIFDLEQSKSWRV